MKTSMHLSRISLICLRPKPLPSSRTTHSLVLHSRTRQSSNFFSIKSSSRPFSTTLTPYQLQYDMIISRPAQSSSPSQPRRRPREITQSKPTDSPDSNPIQSWDLMTGPIGSLRRWLRKPKDFDPYWGMQRWISRRRSIIIRGERKCMGQTAMMAVGVGMMGGFVVLKPEVVELRTLHKREEELYFYDAFAYPWEKEKHYRMVYQLEKEYFPDQCFDKAFLQPGESNANAKLDRVKKIVGKNGERKEKAAMDGGDERRLVFFEDEAGKDERDKGSVKDVKIDVSERKVEEFFKCLKKVPNKNADIASAEPFISTKSTGLPRNGIALVERLF